MANTRKYFPEMTEVYQKRVERIKRAAKNSKFKSYIALACYENPSLTAKMVSNVLHNKKWLHADEVLPTVEKVLKLPSYPTLTAAA
jgi:hypothetical protein